jgi:nitrous oxidase accessory protein NosD
MKKPLPLAVLAVVFACAMYSAPARAQASRTFVSSTGSDSNTCANVATPCRHFAAAFAATAANGEIYVLDPANYGSLTITHAVSIQGHGWGSVAPQAGGTAITIAAPTTDDINLNGLTIDGTALTSTNGIIFTSGRSLTIENCVVRNAPNSGLQFIPNVSAATSLSVSNSSFNNSASGILIQPSSSR